MIDIHSHTLPGIDDGSSSVQESLTMLEALAAQGIGHVAATPHFYADENDPERFLQHREEAAGRLKEAYHEGLPQLLLGAEVYYFNGISRIEALPSLCYEGTNLLLLEMPFDAWSDRTLQEVLDIGQRRGLQVILAHIERYFRFVPDEVFDELLDNGILTQCNARFFLRWQTRHKAVHMLRDHQITLIGSDCHNVSSRPPMMGDALAAVGPQGRAILEENVRRYFPMLEG